MAVIVLILVIRRLGLGLWGSVPLVGVLVFSLIGILVLHYPQAQSTDFTLAFARDHALVATTGHMISDNRWTGSGAGTFGALLPIYRSIEESLSSSLAPTAAAAISVELGRPVLWAIVAATLFLAASLLRGALQRGRDSFYSAAGASIVLIMLIEAFLDSIPRLLENPKSPLPNGAIRILPKG
jgi:hypothetical protein